MISLKYGNTIWASVYTLVNNNNNQYIYKQRQSHAMSQRRWLATAVIFRPSDMSLGFAETWTVIAPATAETLEGGSRALVHRWRKSVDQWLSETAAPIGHSMTTSAAGDDSGCQQADDRDHSSTPGHDRGCTSTRAQQSWSRYAHWLEASGALSRQEWCAVLKPVKSPDMVIYSWNMPHFTYLYLMINCVVER